MMNITFSLALLSRRKRNFAGNVKRLASLPVLLISLLPCVSAAQKARLISVGGVQTQQTAIARPEVSAATSSSSGVNFGTVNTGSTSAPATLTFAFTSPGSGVSVNVLTLGAKNGDFADVRTGTCTSNGASHTYTTGDTCTVIATLTPSFNGQRNGAVQLVDATGQIVALAYIYGVGYGPQITYPSAAQTTVGGNNFLGPIGVAVDGSGNIYVASTNDYSSIQEYVAATGNVVTVGSGFYFPGGVAVDGAGNIYLGDAYNNSVKEIVVATGAIVTLGGGYAFNQPGGVAVDGSGNVYVADYGNSAVEEILASDGSVHTLGSGFVAPTGIAVDSSGNVYVADPFDGSGLVKEIVLATGNVKTLGSGFYYPKAVAVDGVGNVYVADSNNNAVKVISATDGSIRTIGSGFTSPGGITLDAAGNVYIANYGSSPADTGIFVENYATAPSLNFATPTQVDTLDTTDGPQSLPLMNIGSAPLTLTPTSGRNPSLSSGFGLAPGTTTCATSNGSSTTLLASNATCTYAVNFAPLTAGPVHGTLTLTDNNTTAFGPAKTQSQSIQLTGTGFGSATITVTGTLPAATVAANYSGSFTAAGGAAPYTFTATGVPPGLTLSSAGTLSGTPTKAGPYTITVTATDIYGLTGSATFSLFVGDSTLDFQLTLPNSTVQTIMAGASAQYALSVSPAAGYFPFPVSFSITGLPAGYRETFTPATVTPGTGTVQTQLTIQSDTTFASRQVSNPFGIVAAFLFLPLVLSNKLRRRLNRSVLAVLLLCGALAATVNLTGCVGNHVNPATYNVVITATGNGHQHSVSTVLMVQ